MRSLLAIFGEAFDQIETYSCRKASEHYLQDLLAKKHFIALAAICDGKVLGGLTAYELAKYEKEYSEIYIYDLAVAAPHRRQGIATTLIKNLQSIAKQRGAHIIFVQADYGDDAAIRLYSKLGAREKVLHFDIPV